MGEAGAGKTTLATALSSGLAERLNYIALKRSFAGCIRNALCVVGVTKTEKPLLYRRLAQTIGAACRSDNREHFINLLMEYIEREAAVIPGNFIIILDDVRYENEMALCDTIFFLRREPWMSELPISAASHESEELAQKINGGWDMWNHPDFTMIRNHQDNAHVTVEEMLGHLKMILPAMSHRPASPVEKEAS